LGYLELELKHSNFNEVENLFTRCLKTVLSVDLWKFYLNYIRRINNTDDGKLESDTRVVIEKAYDYVLNNVGIDKDSGPIWSDYIFFLKNAEVILCSEIRNENLIYQCCVAFIRLLIRGKNKERWIACDVFINVLFPSRSIMWSICGKNMISGKMVSIG
jgi:hypothetical protein